MSRVSESFGYFGLLCMMLIIGFSAFYVGALWRQDAIYRQLIDRGLAEYDAKTGVFKWKNP